MLIIYYAKLDLYSHRYKSKRKLYNLKIFFIKIENSFRFLNKIKTFSIL
jgi:hypothetical protein